MNEQQAIERLRNEEGGAFLIRFNIPTGFLLSKKSSDGDSVVEFTIEASVSVCFIRCGSECMKVLNLKKNPG